MNIISWLFTDPYTAGSNAGLSGPETFHYGWPWAIFCAAGLIICFYYAVEGRKRFVKNNPVVKYMLDRYLGWFAVICFVGFPILLARLYLDQFFFAWRVWRYLWLLWLVGWAVVWVVYLFRRFPRELAGYRARQNQLQYMPKKSNKRKTASAR